ncbi:MAG: hypothetical protein O2783_05525, partial [Chloroflexi bacterium]|nr:hypothetical protein [Chloroflexota bacterium]
MKTKGRFIAILAVLSLLIAILPIGPAGAATGTVALDKTYYSDKTTFNIVTISVTDSDISAGRVGTARFVATSADAGVGADPLLLTGVAGTGFVGAVLAGEASKTDTFSGDGSKTAFTLTKTARDHRTLDSTGVGVLNHADVQAVVGGTTLTATTDYTVNFATGIVTFVAAPAAATDNVVLNYETSEYNQTTPATTPLRLFGTSVKYGA